jgi:hypothetical protein
MAKMVDAVQPHTDETITAAMTCSHAGSMGNLLSSKLLGVGGGVQSVKLPNPVFIAVSDKTIYAFKYAPRGFKFKIKKEVARWSKDEVTVEAENTGAMANIVFTTASGESYPLEVATIMGARELVDMFIEALKG